MPITEATNSTNETEATNTESNSPSDSNSIQLSEIMAAPDSGDEWVEIVNNAITSVSLEDWTLHDKIGEVWRGTTNDIVAPNQYFVATGWSNKLNNSGDDALLYDNNGVLVDQNTFWESDKGQEHQ